MDIDEVNLIKDQLKHEKANVESFYKEGLKLVKLFTVQDHEKQVVMAADIVDHISNMPLFGFNRKTRVW